MGYPLPPPAQLAPAADAAHGYATRGDEEGLRRVGDELMSSLLGPVTLHMPQVRRIVFVLDGALNQLPIERLPPDADAPPLNETIATATVSDYAQLIDALRQPAVLAPKRTSGTGRRVALTVVAILAAAMVAWGLRRRA